jgi:putative hydrolase of the HAD superfamily
MASFERSLVDCFTELSEAPPSDEQRQRIATFAHSIADRAIELLAGVAETLPLLASRHRLILVTKGNAREQQNKLDRSGIHMHFAAVEIPPEKHPNAYREIVARYGLVHETTWMIGNSPRSDINPALAWERFIAVLRAHLRWPPSRCGDRSSPNACCNRNWAQ